MEAAYRIQKPNSQRQPKIIQIANLSPVSLLSPLLLRSLGFSQGHVYFILSHVSLTAGVGRVERSSLLRLQSPRKTLTER